MAELRIAYFAHSLRSDWNNGNAHFLRGLLRALRTDGHQVVGWEQEDSWSYAHLLAEPNGQRSLGQFRAAYPDVEVQTYSVRELDSTDETTALWNQRLDGVHLVILHEWNTPGLAQLLLTLRGRLGFKILFHDTHHRASSSPESFSDFALDRFDGILAFGESLRSIYTERFYLTRVWTFHEAADVTIFHPKAQQATEQEIVWIGNWGEGERAREIEEFLARPVAASRRSCNVYGVRYPAAGLEALAHAGIRYGGYLPNLDAPEVYARSRLTLHIPRQQYSSAMLGIPTIRVFEALACGIPLLSAPWQDSEQLFRPGDLRYVDSGVSMQRAMLEMLSDPALAEAQAKRGLETILAAHTCLHRAQQLTRIVQELLQ